MKRRLIRVLFLLFLAIIAVGGIYIWNNYPTLALFSAYKAKWVCSEVFVAGRTPQAVRSSDFNDGDLARIKEFKTEIDESNGTVTVSYFGLAKRTAVFRPDIGASLAIGSARPNPALARGREPCAPSAAGGHRFRPAR